MMSKLLTKKVRVNYIMEKKKIIVLVLSVVLIMSVYMTYRTYENKPKELPEEKEKIETKRKQFAMYIKDGDNYVEYKGVNGTIKM